MRWSHCCSRRSDQKASPPLNACRHSADRDSVARPVILLPIRRFESCAVTVASPIRATSLGSRSNLRHCRQAKRVLSIGNRSGPRSPVPGARWWPPRRAAEEVAHDHAARLFVGFDANEDRPPVGGRDVGAHAEADRAGSRFLPRFSMMPVVEDPGGSEAVLQRIAWVLGGDGYRGVTVLRVGALGRALPTVGSSDRRRPALEAASLRNVDR